MDKDYKAYIAGPWFDDYAKEQLDYIKRVYRDNYYITDIECYFPDEHNNDTPLGVYNSNVENIKDCDFFVALISRKDVGTAYELGIASALNKPILLVGDNEDTFKSKTNIMLAFCTKFCITKDKFVNYLLNKGWQEADCIKIPNTWEDKE